MSDEREPVDLNWLEVDATVKQDGWVVFESHQPGYRCLWG
jgi:hypothetical protein